MTATRFVVRSDAGAVSHGVVGSSGDALIASAVGDEVSLNLQQSQVLSYMRDGTTLRVTLVNGEVIVIDGYFDQSGAPQAELYLSSKGTLTEVELSAGEGALLNAQYVWADPVAKWSPDEALYFAEDGALALDGVEDVSAFAMPTGLPLGLIGLGALAAAGAASAMSGGSVASSNSTDDVDQPSTTPTTDAPVVTILGGTKESGHIVNADDQADGVTVSGTGTPNATGTITIGSVTSDLVVDSTGNWTATFAPDAVLPGEYETSVTVEISNDGGDASAIATIAVDTVAEVTFDPDAVVPDGVVDGEDLTNGITLDGTTQPGSTVVVTVGGQDLPATVVDDVWTVDVPDGVIAVYDEQVEVVVTVTDPAGNTDSTTGIVNVDAQTFITLDTSSAGGDGVVNEAEHPSGVTVNGVAEPGSSIEVTLGDAVLVVAASYDGTWQATFPSSVVPTGELELPVTAVSTDPAGNSATATGSVLIDTDLDLSIDDVAEGVVNLVERADGISLTGSADAGADIVVDFGGKVHTTTAGSDGTWSVGIDAADIPQGELSVPVDVTATDAAGNIAMASTLVEVDTVMQVSINASSVEGDGIINAAEQSDGVTLTGQSQAGASVVVDFEGVSQTVTADANGDWAATYAASDVPTGEFDATVTATATDAAGNTATTTGIVGIDTDIGLTLSVGAIGGDGTINASERDAGVEITGTTDANASVSVTFAGTTKTVTADGDGNWSASYAAAEIPQGTSLEQISATATDVAGNTASTSGSVQIDTSVDPLTVSDSPVETDDIVNALEAADGISLNGTVEAGSSVLVTFSGTTHAATVTSDGQWSVNFAASEVPAGTYDATVTIAATDAAGNSSTISDTFAVDTQVPDAPNIESFVKGEDGLRGFGIKTTAETITVSEFVEGSDAATSVDLGSGGFENPITGELNFGFADGHAVPNGSHLVVTASDAAGNANSTFFVLDDSAGASAIDVTAGALDGFNIGAIDLELFAEEANISISAADIAALSQNDNALVINGKSDDTINLDGTATEVGSKVIDGHDYTVFDVDGGEAQLIIRDGIEFNQSVI